MTTINKPPVEKKEWLALAKHLRKNGYFFTHIANESGLRGSSYGNIFVMLSQKNKKAQGTSKGFPDYVVLCKNRQGIVFIELKRQRMILASGKVWRSPSKVSDEQKAWVEALSHCWDNIMAEIAYWADDAVRIIEEFDK